MYFVNKLEEKTITTEKPKKKILTKFPKCFVVQLL